MGESTRSQPDGLRYLGAGFACTVPQNPTRRLSAVSGCSGFASLFSLKQLAPLTIIVCPTQPGLRIIFYYATGGVSFRPIGNYRQAWLLWRVVENMLVMNCWQKSTFDYRQRAPAGLQPSDF